MPSTNIEINFLLGAWTLYIVPPLIPHFVVSQCTHFIYGPYNLSIQRQKQLFILPKSLITVGQKHKNSGGYLKKLIQSDTIPPNLKDEIWQLESLPNNFLCSDKFFFYSNWIEIYYYSLHYLFIYSCSLCLLFIYRTIHNRWIYTFFCLNLFIVKYYIIERLE